MSSRVFWYAHFEGTHPSLCIHMALKCYNSINLKITLRDPSLSQTTKIVKWRNKHHTEKRNGHSMTIQFFLTMSPHKMWTIYRHYISYFFSRYIQRPFIEKTFSFIILCRYLFILLVIVKFLIRTVYKYKWEKACIRCTGQALCCG